jgi:hypothetical protein
MSLDHPPYVEDIIQKDATKDILIKELQKQLEEASKK